MQRLTVSPTQIDFPTIRLNGDQSHYLRRVLRLDVGDRFQAIDGQGTTYLVELQANQAAILEQLPTVNRELPITVHAVIAIPKGNGLDDVVRACTELGVSHIHPVTSERTLLSPSAHRQQRWLKIAQEAAEQCERAIVPTIHTVSPWPKLAASVTGQKKICVTRITAPHLWGSLSWENEIWLAIGPEGGWTESEISQALAHGWDPVGLGPRILRTITAPIAALAIVGSWLDNASPP